MLYKRILLFLLFTIICARAFSTVFIVTSNADAGTGTLRDALTQAAANGSATQDIINFNLPDVSIVGRTITLITQLPDLSSNLVIDGTTQPGSNFGVSDAKVCLVNSYEAVNFAQTDILDGSNIADFSMIGLWLVGADPNSNQSVTINIANSGNISFTHCLVESGTININSCNSFIFQSNLIGYFPDGITGYPSTINVDNTLNVAIGGSNVLQGNLMSGAINLNMDELDQDWTYQISNNKLGTDYTGKSSSQRLFSDYGRITIQSGHYNPPSSGKMHGTITNNMIENFSTAGIVVSGFGNVSIKGNDIGTDATGKINFSQFEPSYVAADSAPTAIALQVGINAIVGGSNPGDANVIAYISNGILEQLANQVVITQNSIFCLSGSFFNAHDFIAYPKPLPQVQINAFTSNGISGTATPGARVELFSNNEGTCPSCDPRDFFAYETADVSGNWSYNGIVPSSVVASAIFNNQTSLFTKAKIDVTNLKVTQPHCGDNKGSISGIKFFNAPQIQWIDQTGKNVSNSLDINNLPPGQYKLKIGNAVCGAETDWIEIVDNSIKLDASNVKIKNPSCNQSGSISGIMVSAYQNENYNSVWLNENLKQVGTSVDISDLVPGTYTLTVTGMVTGCSSTYGPISLKNVLGPNIDQSNQNITSTPCGQSTGAITNIAVTGTGTLKYVWTTSQQQQVGTAKDLTGQPAGVYKLQVTDDTQCGPIYSTDITIPATNGITMDESGAKITFANCNTPNGSITGIEVTGAVKYVWTYAGGTLITTAPYIVSVPAGNYTLTASNGYGCSVTSKTYTIGQNAPTQFPAYAVEVVSSCFQASNGSITVTTDGLVKSARWTDSQGQNAGAVSNLTGVEGGTYQLYLTDQNGCEQLYGTYQVAELAAFNVQNTGTTTPDECGLKTGNVPVVTVVGGAPPYTYVWTDADGKQIGSGNSISNLSAGIYKLSVSDTRCGSSTTTYTVVNDETPVNTPSVSNVQLCSAGSALLSVNNADAPAVYRLYDSPLAAQPIDEQQGGRFNVTVNANKSFFISQVNGTCESNRAEIDVTVGLSALNIANTITPNGDNINDHWDITGIENYPAATIQIFTRSGQRIFNSTGYSKPFDGTYNGAQLPAGVYYYIINLSINCNLLSGSLTVLR